MPSYPLSRKFYSLLTFVGEAGVLIGYNKRRNQIHKKSAIPRQSRIKLIKHDSRKGTQMFPVSPLCNFWRLFRVSAARLEVCCRSEWEAERKRELRPIGCLESHKLTFNGPNFVDTRALSIGAAIIIKLRSPLGKDECACSNSCVQG